MPGPQGRRAFPARLASSARRGASAPAGAPGVWRVPRTRTVTVQGNDTGAASPFTNDWVQPDDMADSVVLSSWHWTQHDPPDGTYFLDYNNEEQARAFALESGFVRYETVDPVVSLDNLPATPFTPDVGDWPSGATGVEFETPTSTLLTARLSGSIRNAADSGTPSAGVWEIPEATLDPGVADVPTGFIGPSQDAIGGTNVFLTTTVDTDPGGLGNWTVQPFVTPYQTFPASQRVGWKIASTAGAFESGVTYPDSFVTDFWGIPTDPLDPRWGSTNRLVEYTYRPPRYRFTF